MATEPHPDARAFLELVAEAPDLHALPPAEARAVHRERSLGGEGSDPDDVAAVHDVVVRGAGHGLPLRVYVPAGAGPFPVLVWAHGGGFVLGDVDTEDPTARALANAGPAVVVSVDYRMAPEHPFPAALRDVYDAAAWAGAEAARFGGDPDRLAVGGASAGGALAAGAARLARDREGPTVGYQLLVYPVAAHGDGYPSRETYDGYFLSREALDWFDAQYLSDPLHGANPYAYPLSATEYDDLPPATVVTAGFDPLRDEGEALVEAFEADGVPVRHRDYDDMVHTFLGKLGAPEWERAREAVEHLGGDLRSGLD